MNNNKNKVRLDLLDKEGTQKIALEVYKLMQQGMTLQEATGLSDEALEEVYSLAYGYYNQGKYEESASLFKFLAGACPKVYKYVLGLASSYHQLESYEEAGVGFYIAFHLDPENPIPAYFITDCFLKQNLFEEADEFAQVTILVCENRPEFRDLKERCELIRKSLKAKK